MRAKAVLASAGISINRFAGVRAPLRPSAMRPVRSAILAGERLSR
jgi:hypothetical protein